nr:MAG TPA: hypothetical protein [Caudoviricetes sp.]DAY63425.1 MAG TPA: hypothetical protein [Caudoviricetes sp.]
MPTIFVKVRGSFSRIVILTTSRPPFTVVFFIERN